MTFKQYIINRFPEAYNQYLLSKMKPAELIGKKVVSIISGFSSSEGGTEMIIEKIESETVYFKSTEKSKHLNNNGLGWATPLVELDTSVKLV